MARVLTWVAAAAAAALAFLAVVSLAIGDTVSAATFGLLAGFTAWGLHSSRRGAQRAARSARAAAQWTPERVRDQLRDAGVPVSGDAGADGADHADKADGDTDGVDVAGVRALRVADPRLSLLDAVELVRAAR